MTPEQFVARWRNTTLGERASYQAHFIDLCHLLNVPPPDGSGTDGKGRVFQFEHGVKKDGGAGGHGFADVYYQGHFAIEYKAPGKYATLDDAYTQLKRYRENLNNPPLLVVTDIATWEVHTNFTNAANIVHRFTHEDIAAQVTDARGASVENRALRTLRALFTDPNSLHPDRTAARVTADAAAEFQKIAAAMRGQGTAQPENIAHFLTKIVFCLFAEDVGLLPVASSGRGLFTEIVEDTYTEPSRFIKYMQTLFKAMAVGGDVMMREIKWFNGKLFEDVTVEELPFEALTTLRAACRLDWSNVEPAIFGTLFERSLDPAKRSQLGAHYTSPDDINLIIEPVLMAPLRRVWAEVQTDAELARQKYDAAPNKAEQHRAAAQLAALRDGMLARLREVKVLDPACGSGNFLYMSLRALLDLEKQVIHAPYWNGDGFTQVLPEVHPSQMYGIEINPIAHDLATIVVWIGWIQWKLNNGYPNYPEPILRDLGQNVQQADAILAFDADGNPVEPDWPAVDVIVGNPPFLGSRKMRPELGDQYIDDLLKAYESSVGDFTPDLVAYWFEKGLQNLKRNRVKRVGLLATNSIRGGTNRHVLERIVSQGQIFMAWSDREWILDGAAVRVSMVGYDMGGEQDVTLNGAPVDLINPDLTSSVDITIAKTLDEMSDIGFQGIIKRGPFDIPYELAMEMLQATNEDETVKNSDVLKPIRNASDIMRRPSNRWIIDFGVDTPLEVAKNYNKPFEYIKNNVKPMRAKANQETAREYWWLHWNPRPAMREKLYGLRRFIATPAVAKYRTFVWLDKTIHPDHALIVFARDDDYFFGVLHSRLHEVWSLRMGTWLGKGNDPRYTPTTTFETFPFPWSPGTEDTSHPAYVAVSAAAAALASERAAWLGTSPPGPLSASGEGEQSSGEVPSTFTERGFRGEVQNASGEGEQSGMESGLEVPSTFTERGFRGEVQNASGEGEWTSPPGPLSASGEGEQSSVEVPSTFTERGFRGEVNAPRKAGPWNTPTDLWRQLKPLARQMRQDPTPAEKALWEALRNRKVADAKFRRQHTIDRFIVDFYCAEVGLVVEVDGAIHQYTQEEDAVRQALLEHWGLRVVRFTNDQVLNDMPAVLREIEGVLTSPPGPLSASGEGEQSGMESGLEVPSTFTERGFRGEVQNASSEGEWTSPPGPLSASGEGEQSGMESGLEVPSTFTERGFRGEVKNLQDRTLTNLYNALAKWRDPAGYDGPATKPDADAFAPRLDELHTALDHAVCAAYGWPPSVLDDDEEILRRLLALNLQRAGG